jgi:hypothetical protein
MLSNADISVPSETKKRLGTTLLKDLGGQGTGAYGFMPKGGTNELLVTYGTNLAGCTNPAETGTDTFTVHKNNFTTGLATTILKVTCSGTNGDVLIISNGTDNIFQMLQDHTFVDLVDTSTSPPKSTVIEFFNNRLWVLKSNLLYWSAALPSTYLAQFDRVANNYAMTVGEEMGLVGIREMGLIAFGKDAVYGIQPSTTPAATDTPQKILDFGCVASKSVCQVGDDVLFLAPDGVRGVFRTQLDKMQAGESYPLSYVLKNEFDSITWAYIQNACAVWFDNKYLLALPTNSSIYNNQVWVYYPATKSWSIFTGWNVGAWGKIKINGQERLYYIDGSTPASSPSSSVSSSPSSSASASVSGSPSASVSSSPSSSPSASESASPSTSESASPSSSPS